MKWNPTKQFDPHHVTHANTEWEQMLHFEVSLGVLHNSLPWYGRWLNTEQPKGMFPRDGGNLDYLSRRVMRRRNQ